MVTHPVPSQRDGVSYLYMLAAFVVIVAAVRAIETILNPLLLAVFLSVMCAPAYFGLLRRGVSQWLALLLITGGLSAIAESPAGHPHGINLGIYGSAGSLPGTRDRAPPRDSGQV